jgi:hypothetical protein
LAAVDGLLGGDLLGRLERWLADARTDDEVAARVRTRWLSAQADEAATFAGVLVDLAEHRTAVVVTVAGGRQLRVTVLAVGRDFFVAAGRDGSQVLVALSWVRALRPDPTGAAPAGDRELVLDAELADAVATLAGDRPRVVVATGDGETIAGRLQTVGRDLVTLRLDGGAAPTVYLQLQAVASLALA